MSMYLRALAVLFSLACCQTGVAVTINTWIDDQGVRHFSQFPPTDDEQAVDILELETQRTTTESASSQDRIQTILDVARDLEGSRLQREQQRAEQAAATAAARPAPPEYLPEPDAIFLPYPNHPYPPHYPHWKHKPHKPEPPDGHRPDPPRSRIHTTP